MNKAYQDFIDSKRIVDTDAGFDVSLDAINPQLFDFQKYLVQWALKRGRSAVFADCGLGKTPIQLEWAKHIVNKTNRPALIFAPLAVSFQTQREGEKFGIPVTICRSQDDVQPGINITNYEMIHKFKPTAFSAVVLDESSILKGLYGKFRQAVTDFALQIPFRLACTATPAPNDTMEIVNHAEFLGVMTTKEVYALFFTQDFTATSHKWRLKKYAEKDFWKWLASWTRALRMPTDLGFDNNGFILPELKIHQHTTEIQQFANGMLFVVEANTLDEQRQSRKESLEQRIARCVELIGDSDEQWLIWCDLNIESQAATKAIPGAVEITGSDSTDHKEKAPMDFVAGKIRILVTKPLIAGFGLNLQNCHNVIFLGLSHSFEKYYQAIRRCWRFGQQHEVNAHIVISESDGAVVRNIQRKEEQATEIFTQLLLNLGEFQTMKSKREEAEYIESEISGKGWTLYLGDSVSTIDRLETDSVGLSVFSPPFPSMYVYTNSPHDMGNVKNIDEMLQHFGFLASPEKLLRITMPGRICAIHLTQGLAFKHSDGYVGLKDFRGRVISTMENGGWIYYGEVAIDKDPQLKALRTKDQGLLFQTLNKDSSKSRMAMADYVLQFKKPGDNPVPVRAGKADHLKNSNEKGWITNKEWIEWAAPIWYRQTDFMPGGIRESDVLNVRTGARTEEDERHLCPLQLGVIERCILLWSNPGELVYSPFAGIGSEGYEALRLNRRFVGGELKKSYFDVAVSNLREAEKLSSQDDLDLFSCSAQ
jgi:hypothetical protein